jgi:hypothetical protein
MGAKAITISYLIYSLTGLAGASSSIIPNKQSSTSQNELNQELLHSKMPLLHQLAASSWLGKAVVFANMGSIYLSLPVFLINLRTYSLYLRRLVFRNPAAPEHMLDKFMMVILFAISLYIAYAIPTLEQLIAAISGCTDCLFMLVFPTLLSLRLRPNQHVVSKLLSGVLLGIGASLFLSTVLTWNLWGKTILGCLVVVMAYQTR